MSARFSQCSSVYTASFLSCPPLSLCRLAPPSQVVLPAARVRRPVGAHLAVAVGAPALAAPLGAGHAHRVRQGAPEAGPGIKEGQWNQRGLDTGNMPYLVSKAYNSL